MIGNRLSIKIIKYVDKVYSISILNILLASYQEIYPFYQRIYHIGHYIKKGYLLLWLSNRLLF